MKLFTKYLVVLTLALACLVLILNGPVFAAGDITGMSLTQLGVIFNRIITALLGIAGSFVIILIVVGAIRYIVSGGDPKAIMAAKNSITFAFAGLVIILLAVAIVLIIGNLFGVGGLNIFNLSIGS